MGIFSPALPRHPVPWATLSFQCTRIPGTVASTETALNSDTSKSRITAVRISSEHENHGWVCSVQCEEALPVGLTLSGRSGAAPWWRWSTGQPEDGQTSAGMCYCILDGPGHDTGRQSTDPSSIYGSVKERQDGK